MSWAKRSRCHAGSDGGAMHRPHMEEDGDERSSAMSAMSSGVPPAALEAVAPFPGGSTATAQFGFSTACGGWAAVPTPGGLVVWSLRQCADTTPAEPSNSWRLRAANAKDGTVADYAAWVPGARNFAVFQADSGRSDPIALAVTPAGQPLVWHLRAALEGDEVASDALGRSWSTVDCSEAWGGAGRRAPLLRRETVTGLVPIGCAALEERTVRPSRHARAFSPTLRAAHRSREGAPATASSRRQPRL